jgi:hypothetical protein
VNTVRSLGELTAEWAVIAAKSKFGTWISRIPEAEFRMLTRLRDSGKVVTVIRPADLGNFQLLARIAPGNGSRETAGESLL